jgi:amino acid adenylation domain-containing protein
MKFVQMCLAHAGHAPGRVALSDGKCSLTFGELRTAVAQMMGRIERRGVRPGDVVAVAGRKTVWNTVAALAVMELGAAYLPVDPQPPRQRTRDILARVGAALYIDDREVDLGDPSRRVVIDRLLDAHDVAAPMEEGRRIEDEAATAYIIFTSGSTGSPRGVCISHAALCAFVSAIAGVMDYGPNAVCLALAPPYFDVAIQDTLVPLALGASIHLHDGLPIPALVLGRLLSEGITHTTLVASNLALLAADPGLGAAGGQLPGLKRVMTGAEAPARDAVVALLRAAPNARVINGYGPTELTVCCTAHEISKETAGDFENYPIGPALPGLTVVLVDADGAPTRGDQPGEICVAGPQLMTGYFAEPAATEKVIVEIDGERFYRTGDLGRRLPRWGFEFLGRIDAQAKIRGYRVHPEELRSVILSFGGVRDAYVCTIVIDERAALGAVVESTHEGLQPSQLREHIAKRLPPYLQPARLRLVNELPRTRNGKADANQALALLAE